MILLDAIFFRQIFKTKYMTATTAANHEVWVTCPECKDQFDGRQFDDCPACNTEWMLNGEFAPGNRDFDN